MESFQIEATNTTPYVRLDAETGVLDISGISDEQDALAFYFPVIQWIEAYLLHPQPETTLNLRFKYFNTASSKALFEIIKRLEVLLKQDKQLVFNWYYTEEDENLKEDIEYFTDLTNIPINVIS